MKKNLVIGTISIIVVVAMAAILLSYEKSLDEAIMYLKGANYWILLLLIPNVILMYYAAGRIWYPYLKNDGISADELGRIQYELNFVNTVVPTATISGLIYATKRLKAYGIDGGRTAWLYLYRYVVSIVTNWLGIVGSAIYTALSRQNERYAYAAFSDYRGNRLPSGSGFRDRYLSPCEQNWLWHIC